MPDQSSAVEAAQRAGMRAREWWDSLSEEEQAFWRDRGSSGWDAFWMARRCGTDRQRGSDICPTNGNGNGNGIGNGRPRATDVVRGQESGLLRSKVIKMPTVTPSATIKEPMNGNGNGNGNGAAVQWYQNPLVWAGLGLGAVLFLRRAK